MKYERSEPAKVAMASYTGYMAELEKARNALQAWSATNGYDVTGRAYESYKSGVASAFTERRVRRVLAPEEVTHRASNA